MDSPPDRQVRIWIVEDAAAYRWFLARLLDAVPGWTCEREFADAESAIAALESHAGPPDILLLDIGLPGSNGDAALPDILRLAPDARVVVLSGNDSEDVVLGAIRAGASGYLLKDGNEESVVARVREALDFGCCTMSPDIGRIVIEHVRRGQSADGHARYRLTARESEVLALLTKGLQKKEIADRLSVSHHTVDTHLRNIYRRLDVRSNIEAFGKAMRERLV